MLIATDIDRVHGIVATFRFPDQPGVVVHPNSVDDAVQFAFERLAKMFGTFEGTELVDGRSALTTNARLHEEVVRRLNGAAT